MYSVCQALCCTECPTFTFTHQPQSQACMKSMHIEHCLELPNLPPIQVCLLYTGLVIKGKPVTKDYSFENTYMHKHNAHDYCTVLYITYSRRHKTFPHRNNSMVFNVIKRTLQLAHNHTCLTKQGSLARVSMALQGNTSPQSCCESLSTAAPLQCTQKHQRVL